MIDRLEFLTDLVANTTWPLMAVGFALILMEGGTVPLFGRNRQMKPMFNGSIRRTRVIVGPG